MGRHPTVNRHLPARMHALRQRSGKVYYYYDAGGTPRKRIPLGPDYVLAVQQWAKLNLSAAPVRPTFGYAVARYLAHPDYLSLGKGTRDDYKFALDKLLIDFASEALDDIPSADLRKHHERRQSDLYDDKGDLIWQGSLHRANREISVMGMIFRFARDQGLTKNDPREPIKLKKLPGRKHVYIHDEMLQAVYEKSPPDLQEAIDLGYYIGQRPVDLLAMAVINVRDGKLEYRQRKTGTPQRIVQTPPLKELLDRIAARKARIEKERPSTVHSLTLLVDERGRPMTKAKLRARFEKAREAAGIKGEDFQFRDLRRKSGSDLRDLHGLEAAQEQLGHKTVTQTEHYTGAARGKIISKLPPARKVK